MIKRKCPTSFSVTFQSLFLRWWTRLHAWSKCSTTRTAFSSKDLKIITSNAWPPALDSSLKVAFWLCWISWYTLQVFQLVWTASAPEREAERAFNNLYIYIFSARVPQLEVVHPNWPTMYPRLLTDGKLVELDPENPVNFRDDQYSLS